MGSCEHSGRSTALAVATGSAFDSSHPWRGDGKMKQPVRFATLGIWRLHHQNWNHVTGAITRLHERVVHDHFLTLPLHKIRAKNCFSVFGREYFDDFKLRHFV